MKNKNGYTTLQMLIVIGILGTFTLIMIGTTSHAYKDNSLERYDEKIHLIMKQARDYGETLGIEVGNNLMITLNDLIKNDYYVADDSEGNVIDPRNSKATLNGLRINLIRLEDGSIKAEVLEN